MLIAMSACEKADDVADTDKPVRLDTVMVSPDKAINPDSIIVEVYEGHTHIKGDQPKIGSVFWANARNGFHADPTIQDFPMKAYQKMVLKRDAKGKYVPDTRGVSDFLVQTSPYDEGVVYAMTVKLYGEGGQRLDLRYKSASWLNRIQVFYRVKRVKPIEPTIPQNLIESDTLFTIDEVRDDDEELADKLIKEGLTSPFTLRFQSQEQFKPDTPNEKLFYFFYQDKATDSSTDIKYFDTPVGFRGVFVNRIPAVQYAVEVFITDLQGGKPEAHRQSSSPTTEQLQNVSLSFELPFKNLYEMEGWGHPVGDERLIQLVYEKEYTYFISEKGAERVYNNWNVYIPILREFPNYTVEQLRAIFEENSGKINKEGSDFWL